MKLINLIIFLTILIIGSANSKNISIEEIILKSHAVTREVIKYKGRLSKKIRCLN